MGSPQTRPERAHRDKPSLLRRDEPELRPPPPPPTHPHPHPVLAQTTDMPPPLRLDPQPQEMARQSPCKCQSPNVTLQFGPLQLPRRGLGKVTNHQHKEQCPTFVQHVCTFPAFVTKSFPFLFSPQEPKTEQACGAGRILMAALIGQV